MKIIAFIEANQTDVIRKILQHCDLCDTPQPHPPPRAPPKSPHPAPPVRSMPEPDSASPISYELAPDFLEHLRREEQAD